MNEQTPKKMLEAVVSKLALRVDASNQISAMIMPDGTHVSVPLTVVAVVGGGVAKAKTIDDAVAQAMRWSGIPKKERLKTYVELFFVFRPLDEVHLHASMSRFHSRPTSNGGWYHLGEAGCCDEQVRLHG